MKKILFLILNLLLLITSAYSQSNWLWQNPLPQGNNLSRIQFVDQYTGYAAGWNFTILKTTNSGDNWFITNSHIDSIPNGISSSQILNAIYFINSETGFVGNNGIFKTTNGGNNWVYRNPGIEVLSIQFVTADIGYAVGSRGKISKTTDGGNNWSVFLTGGTGDRCSELFFVSPDTGFILESYQGILKTTNGGNTWVFKVGFGVGDIYDLFFFNNNVGYTCGFREKILKTIDGGENWFYLPSQSNINDYSNIYFTSLDTGYLISNHYLLSSKILKTTNGGNNWNEVYHIDTFAEEIFFINHNVGYIVCNGGHILKSSDQGNNWINKTSNLNVSDLISIDFINENTGYATGGNSFVKTTNAGLNWNEQNIPNIDSLNYINFFNESTGIISGSKIFKTTNSGFSWDSLSQFSGIAAIDFFNLDTGYFIRQQNLYETLNGGINWSFHSFENELVAFDYLENNDTGYVVTKYYVGVPPITLINDVFITIDNGLHWNLLSRFTGAVLLSIKFNSNGTGYVSGNGIYKTTNGGNTWTNIYQGQFLITNGPYFYNDNIGYSISSNTLYKTTNSGNTWSNIFYSSETWGAHSLNNIFFTSINTGYIIGSDGKILKTTNGGGIFVGIGDDNENILARFSLTQNYPNPFNPKTVINYELGIANYISLIVYDALGKKVTTLINESQNIGSYSVSFDGNNLPSGVYFYKLKAGDFVETKRMVLLK
ncbi:MAG: YCF48-related protein [Ignavibacteria bacterium]